ncbi:hypothetical protein [Clostridium folliculivorans]|uniref:hypothetical protein n=1 Tax=Clostridium folliculivorans TaxID=2886038 RepID=UPI0021C3484B|nr:hypothetical protein [Clostridium folliculivorans]GKU29287.1 hypothetical protein CFB3_13930 [Clostridium folliculivorans]
MSEKITEKIELNNLENGVFFIRKRTSMDFETTGVNKVIYKDLRWIGAGFRNHRKVCIIALL